MFTSYVCSNIEWVKFFRLEQTSPIPYRCVGFDMVLNVEKLAAINDASSNEQKTYYKA